MRRARLRTARAKAFLTQQLARGAARAQIPPLSYTQLRPKLAHGDFVIILRALEHSTRSTVVTSVARAFPRSPMKWLRTSHGTRQLSGGRFAMPAEGLPVGPPGFEPGTVRL